MRVSEDHAELVPDGNSSNHVADSAANGTQDCVSLFLLEPHSEFKGVSIALSAFLFADIDGDVLEAPGKGAQLALDCNFPCLQVDRNALWDLELLFSNDKLHLLW